MAGWGGAGDFDVFECEVGYQGGDSVVRSLQMCLAALLLAFPTFSHFW